MKDKFNAFAKPTEQVEVQINKISASVPSECFVDFLTVFGEKDRKLRVFDDSGEFLTHDGLHLTRKGAEFFGKRSRQVLLNIIKQ
jgi:hypothetical protein